MYSGIKVVSKQVQTEISGWMQNLLWYLIETMEAGEIDQTQFFELSSIIHDETIKQKIVHYQQKPFYQNEQLLSTTQTITAKVIVIDNESHCFMLLSPK